MVSLSIAPPEPVRRGCRSTRAASAIWAGTSTSVSGTHWIVDPVGQLDHNVNLLLRLTGRDHQAPVPNVYQHALAWSSGDLRPLGADIAPSGGAEPTKPEGRKPQCLSGFLVVYPR